MNTPLTERSVYLGKKSHETSWQKAKAKEKKQIIERRRATAHAELKKDMRELQIELKKSRKRPSLLNTIRKLFASF